MTPGHAPTVLAAAGLFLAGSFSVLKAQTVTAASDEACLLCHGELEFLRQQTASLERARTLLVEREAAGTAAHGDMSCASCHSGFQTFPHPASVSTESCASCHSEPRDLWSGSVHAGDEEVGCTACHGVHNVVTAASLDTVPGLQSMNAACVDCHDTAALPPSDPHAGAVLCAACHTAHATRAADGPGASVAPLDQVQTCGSCHEEVADSAVTDVHHEALVADGRASLALLRGGEGPSPPTCTSCHGSHGMLAPSHARFDQDMVDQCAVCHADYASTYFGTYHGKATAVGSEIVATCDRCHGSHRIFPASDERSWVNEANLVETCGRCHDRTNASFVAYDSHPDPMDRDRNPPLFFSFVFMNALLVGVLVVFGLHTGLWWVRLLLDKRRGVVHSIGADHE